MHPFFRVFFGSLITLIVAALTLGWMFRDGEDTDRAVHEFQESSYFYDFWLRGKFGIWLTIVIVTAVGTFQGLPLLWLYMVSLYKRFVA